MTKTKINARCICRADARADAASAQNTHARVQAPTQHLLLLVGFLLLLSFCGCTSLRDYVHNGFKVGPNFCAALRAGRAELDRRRRPARAENPGRPDQWWTVFNDPVLDSLICCAYQQNLTLREAGARVLEARAQLAIFTGQILPQTQNVTGDYTRNAISTETANGRNITQQFYNQWDFGFNLAWELDFWGRFRRAIESTSASLDASVADYDDVLVTLLGDVATNYVQLRTLQERIEFAQANVKLLQETLTITEARFRGGTTSELDVYQARSTLEQTEAEIPELEISLRQTANLLCVLLGMPPEDLASPAGPRPIPTAPPEVGVGIPAILLAAPSRRSPDAVASRGPRRRSAWPRPTSTRPSRSTARWATRPSSFPTSSGPRRSMARLALPSNGMC